MAEIQLQHVGKRYPDGYLAVDDLDLTIADGEFMVLVGPSGCGKTTALRMIAGLESITAGDLMIDGQRANGRLPKDRDIAMVFQNYALYPHMTVRRNIGYALKLSGMPKAEVNERVERAGKMLGLQEHLDRRPAELSGGQRQRVAMGRAIVREPKAFLMDEPLSNLDAKLRVAMRAELAAIQTRLGTTTIYVTHDQIEAMTLGDRVAIMRRGILQQVGTPADLYDTPDNLFVASFIGSPSMNLFPGTIADGRVQAMIGDLRLPPAHAQAPAGPVIVGVRPEGISAVAAGEPGSFAATVEVTEALGSDVFVHVSLASDGQHADLDRELDFTAMTDEESGAVGTGQIVARLPGAFRTAPGETVQLAIDAGAIHLFNAETGARM